MVFSVSPLIRKMRARRKPLWHQQYRTALVVQWLRLRAPNAGGPRSIPGQGTRPQVLQLKHPALCNKRNHHNEKPTHRNQRVAPLATCREKPAQQQDPAQPKINKYINFIYIKKTYNARFSISTFFFFWLHCMWDLKSRNQGSKPHSLNWKCRVLTTGRPGKSIYF